MFGLFKGLPDCLQHGKEEFEYYIEKGCALCTIFIKHDVILMAKKALVQYGKHKEKCFTLHAAFSDSEERCEIEAEDHVCTCGLVDKIAQLKEASQ